MSRVLRNPVMHEAARAVGLGTQAEVEMALAEAYQRGHQDGVVQGRRDATAHIEALSTSIVAAFEATTAEVREVVHTEADGRLRASLDIAEFVLGSVPEVDHAELLRRIERAIADIDDEPLTLHLSEADHGTLDTVGFGSMRVVVDPGLLQGEAKVTGPWSVANLSRDAALETARETLR